MTLRDVVRRNLRAPHINPLLFTCVAAPTLPDPLRLSGVILRCVPAFRVPFGPEALIFTDICPSSLVCQLRAICENYQALVGRVTQTERF